MGIYVGSADDTGCPVTLKLHACKVIEVVWNINGYYVRRIKNHSAPPFSGHCLILVTCLVTVSPNHYCKAFLVIKGLHCIWWLVMHLFNSTFEISFVPWKIRNCQVHLRFCWINQKLPKYETLKKKMIRLVVLTMDSRISHGILYWLVVIEIRSGIDQTLWMGYGMSFIYSSFLHFQFAAPHLIIAVL